MSLPDGSETIIGVLISLVWSPNGVHGQAPPRHSGVVGHDLTNGIASSGDGGERAHISSRSGDDHFRLASLPKNVRTIHA
ncbi:hypothetical protein NXC24_PB00065 (plasmid) [Rhizobium sp. NXC24]|nr:hypothetical protein NXC24_PB00065 [Rhizobium sp. NXC24]